MWRTLLRPHLSLTVEGESNSRGVAKAAIKFPFWIIITSRLFGWAQIGLAYWEIVRLAYKASYAATGFAIDYIRGRRIICERVGREQRVVCSFF